MNFELNDVQRTRLEIYKDLLLKWQRRVNLVSDATLPHVWQRHFVDSMQLFPLAGEWANWIDIGSGAGFPGLVIAMLKSDSQTVHLVEADKRKAAFLADVSRETSIPIHLHVGRIELLLPELARDVHFNIISARALASMQTLVRYSSPIIERGGCGLFLKGKELQSELTNLIVDGNFKFEFVSSITDTAAKIVIVQRVDS